MLLTISPGISFTNTWHNILLKALATFPYNHCWDIDQPWERNEPHMMSTKLAW